MNWSCGHDPSISHAVVRVSSVPAGGARQVNVSPNATRYKSTFRRRVSVRMLLLVSIVAVVAAALLSGCEGIDKAIHAPSVIDGKPYSSGSIHSAHVLCLSDECRSVKLDDGSLVQIKAHFASSDVHGYRLLGKGMHGVLTLTAPSYADLESSQHDQPYFFTKFVADKDSPLAAPDESEGGKCSKHEWTQITGDWLYPVQWFYRCVDDGRMDDGNVRRPKGDGELFETYSRGNGYGDFRTLAEAKAQVERIVKARGI